MENMENFKILLLLLRKYHNYLNECDNIWVQASQRAREIEKDLLVLSDQLRCLSRKNQSSLNELELQNTADRVILILEEKYSMLHTALESAITSQDELTSMRKEVESHYVHIEGSDIMQNLIRYLHVTWLLFQTRSSSVSAALKMVNFKSPESIKHLLQCATSSQDFQVELAENMLIAENLMRTAELFL